MRSIWKHSSLVLVGFSLIACENQTSIQGDYVTHRNGCQLYAEQEIGNFTRPSDRNIRARNAKLVTLFSDCMFEQGWTVATPEREDQPEEQEQALQDDLPQLNDVDAGVAAAKAPLPPSAAPAVPALDPNRRAPAQQYQLY